MAVEITTVSVHPDRANALRQIRDERELPSIDAALDEVIKNYETA